MADQKKPPPVDDEWVEVPADEWVEVTDATAPEVPNEPKSLGGFLGNALASGGNLIKDTVIGAAQLGNAALQSRANPAKFAADMAASPFGQAAIADPAGTAGKVASGAKDYFGKRYGGGQEILDTLYEDPFGVAADVSTVATLGGGAAARAPGIVGRVGRGVAAVGSAIDPITAAARGGIVAAAPARRTAEALGERLSRSALNVPKDITRRNLGVNIPREVAEQGIAVSQGGQALNRGRIATDEQAIGRLIDDSTATTTAAPITAPLRELANERRAMVPGSSLHAETPDVDRHVEQIFNANVAPAGTWQPPGPSASFMHPRRPLEGPVHGPSLTELPIQQVQANKVALNQRLQNSFGAQVTPLNTDILHGERRGMMQAIEAAEPGVRPINQRLGPRYAVDDAVSAALARESSLPKTVWGAAQSPYLKSVAARELFRVGRSATPIAAGLEQAGPTLTRLAMLERLGLTRTEP